jgi:hypothetical protein
MDIKRGHFDNFAEHLKHFMMACVACGPNSTSATIPRGADN